MIMTDEGFTLPVMVPLIDTVRYLAMQANNYRSLPGNNDNRRLPCQTRKRYKLDYWDKVICYRTREDIPDYVPVEEIEEDGADHRVDGFDVIRMREAFPPEMSRAWTSERALIYLEKEAPVEYERAARLQFLHMQEQADRRKFVDRRTLDDIYYGHKKTQVKTMQTTKYYCSREEEDERYRKAANTKFIGIPGETSEKIQEPEKYPEFIYKLMRGE